MSQLFASFRSVTSDVTNQTMTNKKMTQITSAQCRRLEESIGREILRLESGLKMLGLLDRETYGKGIAALGSDNTFALWLCQPAKEFGNVSPLQALRVPDGRAKVLNYLGAVEDGGYL